MVQTATALDIQIGGEHYKGFVIQPLSFLVGCVIKRAARYDKEGGKGLEDLHKIKHEIDLLIELNELE